MIKGKLVELQAIEEHDLAQLQKWRNDPNIRKYFREYRELSMQQQRQWYEEKVINDPDTLMFIVKVSKTGESIGVCGFNHVNWIHRRGEISIYIGKESLYIDPDGYAADGIALLLEYGFAQLGLMRIWTETYSFDEKKRDLLTSIGFQEDGILRKNYFFSGQWWDSIVISYVASDYFSRLETSGTSDRCSG